MNDAQLIRHICRSIRQGRFGWKRHLQPSTYYGRELAVTPLFCSYGQIGYCIHFPYSNLPDIDYDWETQKLTVDEMDWKDWMKEEQE